MQFEPETRSTQRPQRHAKENQNTGVRITCWFAAGFDQAEIAAMVARILADLSIDIH